MTHPGFHRARRSGVPVSDGQRDKNRRIRRVLALCAAIPIPGFAYALTLANVGALVALPLRSPAGWPRYVRALLAWSGVSVAVTIASALAQKTVIPTLTIVSTFSFVLLLAGFVKLTDGIVSGVHLLGWSSIGVIAFFALFGSENSQDTPAHLWKYGIAVPIAMLAISIVSQTSTRRLWPIVALLTIGTLSVALGFRSHGMVCFAVVLLLFAKGTAKTRGRAVFKAAVAVILFYAAWLIIPLAIEAGVFGQAVRMRTEEQLLSGASPLLSGRVEPPLSIAAILARPLFGWGNLNAIDSPTIAQGQQIAAQLGLADPSTYMNLWVRRDGRVSVHSVFFEAWAQGGILAAIAPLLLIVLFVSAIIHTHGKWSPVVLLVSVQGIWDVLFSTWGAQRPTILMVSVIIAAWTLTPPLPGLVGTHIGRPQADHANAYKTR